MSGVILRENLTLVVNGLLHRSDRMSKVQYQELLRASEFGLLPRGDERQATPCGPHRGDGVKVFRAGGAGASVRR